MQRESKFSGEDDPSPEHQETYDDLSSSDDDNYKKQPTKFAPQLIKQESVGALSQSELAMAGNLNVERQNIMEKLGDFSMSGLTASNINAGSQLNNKQTDFNCLSDISSDHEPKQKDSLEDRMDKIRKDLNFEYCAKNEESVMSPQIDDSQLENSQLQKSVLSTGQRRGSNDKIYSKIGLR